MPEPTKLTQLEIDRLADTEMTFSEIAERYGEDAAINVGIARDPDTEEITAEMFKQARPAIEAHPHLVAESLLRRRKQEGLMEWEVSVKMDTDVLAHFLAGGLDWQQRINDALRKAMAASTDGPPLGGE